MAPNLIINLDVEPIHFLWNGYPVSLSGKYQLLPDNQVKHLHKRVLAVARDERSRIPFYGHIVGREKKGQEYYYLVENEVSRKIERVVRPQVIEEG